MPELIAVGEIARRFGVTTRTVAKWRVSGRLQCWRAGGRWYTSEQAVQDFLIPSELPREQRRHNKINKRRHDAAVRELTQLLTD